MNRLPNSADINHAQPRISLAGYLAVATPSVQDPVFAKSVCIIVEHTEQQTIGIMLNRPLAIETGVVWEQLMEGAAKPSFSGSHLNFGGPQSGPVLAIHDNEQLAEGGNSQGVYLSAQTDTLKKLAEFTPEHCRLFIGHAVWQVSELEKQIVNGNWHILPAIPELVFSEENTMWQRSMMFVGNSIVSSAEGVRGLMEHPYLN